MTTIFACNKTDTDRLAGVVDAMRKLGAPRIRAIRCAGLLFAVEGSHRLAAASKLGLSPQIEVVADLDLEWPEETDEDQGAIMIRGLDWDVEEMTAAELYEYIGGGADLDGAMYEIDDSQVME
jgi:hypothetical protein